jgi:hypothetical protein
MRNLTLVSSIIRAVARTGHFALTGSSILRA